MSMSMHPAFPLVVRALSMNRPHTLASPPVGERKNGPHDDGETDAVGNFVTQAMLFPLPMGWVEDQGEGIF